MVKLTGAERRIFVRAKRVLSIEYRPTKPLAKKADEMWKLSTTQDMSLGGLTFYTDREFRQGDILEIHVVMSGVLDIFKGLCKVVRVERKKSGAYFLLAVQFTNNKKSRSAKRYVAPAVKPRLRSAKMV
jgi:c-di-GMP-binding flagellar brake protein YcgR